MVLGPTQVQLQQSRFPGDEECDRRTSWAQNKMQRTDRVFKALLLLPWAAFLIIRSKFSFFLWFMFSCHELPPPSPLQPLRGFATAENNRNAAAQVTFPSPSSSRFLSRRFRSPPPPPPPPPTAPRSAPPPPPPPPSAAAIGDSSGGTAGTERRRWRRWRRRGRSGGRSGDRS